MTTRLTDRAMRDIDTMLKNDIEGRDLLDLINAEFQSDPMSTQCFDSRIVERVKWWAVTNKKLRGGL